MPPFLAKTLTVATLALAAFLGWSSANKPHGGGPGSLAPAKRLSLPQLFEQSTDIAVVQFQRGPDCQPPKAGVVACVQSASPLEFLRKAGDAPERAFDLSYGIAATGSAGPALQHQFAHDGTAYVVFMVRPGGRFRLTSTLYASSVSIIGKSAPADASVKGERARFVQLLMWHSGAADIAQFRQRVDKGLNVARQIMKPQEFWALVDQFRSSHAKLDRPERALVCEQISLLRLGEHGCLTTGEFRSETEFNELRSELLEWEAAERKSFQENPAEWKRLSAERYGADEVPYLKRHLGLNKHQ